MNNVIRNQSGAALLTGLLILIVITILAFASTRSGIMQERMTSNARESNDSFQAAEDILRQLETEIREKTLAGGEPNLDIIRWGAGGYNTADCTAAEFLKNSDVTTWPTNALTQINSQEMRYRVIEMTGAVVPCRPLEGGCSGAPPPSSYYLLAAYAKGPQGKAGTTLVSTYYFEDPCV